MEEGEDIQIMFGHFQTILNELIVEQVASITWEGGWIKFLNSH